MERLTNRIIGFSTEAYVGVQIHYCQYSHPHISEVIEAVSKKHKKNQGVPPKRIEIGPKYAKLKDEVVNLENGIQLNITDKGIKVRGPSKD